MFMFLPIWASPGQEAEFRVHVVDPQYENVANAVVQLVSVQESRTATTDAVGAATFVNLPSGRYDIRISAYGFVVWQSRNYDVTVPQKGPMLATLRFGTTGSCDPPYRIEYDNRHSRDPPVRGVIIDADSRKSIRGATLHFRLMDEKKPELILRSQNKGVFELPNIAPGRYRLRVTNEFYRDLEMDLVVPTQDVVIITIELDRNDHVHVCD
jgi:uncharacterized surface anchored protein